MSNRTLNQRGFTLIELMIVVVIIGILAALAIPRFWSATSRSKQSEAKQLLKQIYTMEHSYFQANQVYGDLGATVTAPNSCHSWVLKLQSGARYTYSIAGNANALSRRRRRPIWTKTRPSIPGRSTKQEISSTRSTTPRFDFSIRDVCERPRRGAFYLVFPSATPVKIRPAPA